MFTAIKALLVKLGGYSADSIFQNYPNDTVMPDDNNFIVMNQLHSTPLTALVYTKWSADEINKTSTGKTNQLVATSFQVDFYGENSSAAADRFATALQSYYATAFLREYGYTVRDADSPIQLTHPMDREQYILRYVVRFSLFNNVILTDTIESFDSALITPILAEVKK